MNKEVNIHLNILNGSIWGLLARSGLGVLTIYDGAVQYDALWANFAACLVLGNISKLEKTPFVMGISTGFCGTFSSFSAIVLDLFLASANKVTGSKNNYPNPGYGVMEFLAIIIIQMGVSILGFHIGKHSAHSYPVIPKYGKALSYISGSIGVAAYIANVVLICVKHSWRVWTFSILFAPWGAFLRYHLSRFNNSKYPRGTLMVNIIGTTLIAVFTLLNRARISKTNSSLLVNTLIDCQVLEGLIDGFCGAATTTSTFISEVFLLPTKRAYLYVVTSFASSFIILLLILGPYAWVIGLDDPVCSI